MPLGDTEPTSRSQTIYLIRHGIAKHNICYSETGLPPDLTDPIWTDPPLVASFTRHVVKLGENWRRSHENGQSSLQTVDLVVCSPLLRCLQTAKFIFPLHFQPTLSNETASSLPSQTATAEGKEKAAVHTSDRITSNEYPVSQLLTKQCKLFCHEDVREAFGINYSDKRSPLSRLKALFPTVTYHPNLTEYDTLWSAHIRETRNDVLLRVRNFFHWLTLQPHNSVAVVTHGVWMECALLEYCPDILDRGRKRVYNCDVYRAKLLVGSARDSAAKECEQENRDIMLQDVHQVLFSNAL